MPGERLAGEGSDCAVIALSEVTGFSYITCHEALSNAGRKPGCGTPYYCTRAALEALGWHVVRVWKWEHLALQLDLGRRKPKTADALADPEAWKELPPRMLLKMPEHIGALVNGQVRDWTADREAPIYEAWEVAPVSDQVERRRTPAVIYL